MTATAVIIISQNDIVRSGMQAILQRHSDFVCQPYSTVEHALNDMIPGWRGIILLDDDLPAHLTLSNVLRDLTSRFADVRVIVVSNCMSAYYIHRMLHSGATGYIYKHDHLLYSLAGGIRAVEDGHIFLSPKASGLPYESNQYDGLSQTDLEVLRLLADGLNVQEIAARLNIVDHSIYRSRTRLRQFLGVGNNEQIVDVARRQGLLNQHR